ncbi:hypothetical protein VUR80DRAFT_6145 [Thermomyces stellatus]
MDKIKPSCAALLRRRRRGFKPAQEDNAQDPAAGDHHEMDPIPVAEPDIEQPAAPEPEDEADSVFKYSVYEDGQDPLGYEIGKMISQARKVWQVKINVSPTEWDWRWSNEFEEAFSGRYQQGRPHLIPDTTDFEAFAKETIAKMPANAAAVPIEFMTSALGQVIAHCKAHFHGFDLESIDHAPLATVILNAFHRGLLLAPAIGDAESIPAAE